MTWESHEDIAARDTPWEEANNTARVMTRKALNEMSDSLRAFRQWVKIGYRLTDEQRRLITTLSGTLGQLDREFRL